MRLLTEDALVICDHQLGKVQLIATQNFVAVDSRRLLVRGDPEGKPISGCPNFGPTIKPCTTTLPVDVGYSSFIRIDGRDVCLESVSGLTDGTPPGTVKYSVSLPGQSLVNSDQ